MYRKQQKHFVVVHIFLYIAFVCASVSSQATLKLLAVGGLGNHRLSDVEYFNPYKGNSNCKKKPKYPLFANDHCGDKTTFCGGWDSRSPSTQCFQLMDDVWLPISNLNIGRFRQSCTYLDNDNFWLNGGEGYETGNALKTSEIIRGSEEMAEMSVELPAEMAEHCLTRMNNTHIFLGGGYYNRKMAYIVDTSEEPFTFTTLPDMSEDRDHAACGSFRKNLPNKSGAEEIFIVIAGGYNGNGLASTEIFSTVTNKWIDGPTLPRGFEAGGYFSDSQHPLIMVGGRDENGVTRSDVLSYQKDSNTFELLPGKMVIPRSYFPVTGIYDEEAC